MDRARNSLEGLYCADRLQAEASPSETFEVANSSLARHQKNPTRAQAGRTQGRGHGDRSTGRGALRSTHTNPNGNVCVCSECSKGLPVDDKGPVLVVLLLGYPHGRHRRQRAKDGTAQPRRVLALRQGEHLDSWGCRLGIEGVCSHNAEGCRLGIQGCSLNAERGAGRVHEVVAWVHRGVARLWFGMRRAERRQLLTQPLLQARGESWGKTRVGVRVRVR